MNSATCVTNEEPGVLPTTLIVKFLLYCSMAIMGICLLLLLLAALGGNTGRFLVLALASGVLLWLIAIALQELRFSSSLDRQRIPAARCQRSRNGSSPASRNLSAMFLLYCSMAIMGICLLLLLLATLGGNTGRFLVLTLASGVLLWLIYFCLSSLNKLREYVYILARETLNKCAAVNRPLTDLPTNRT